MAPMPIYVKDDDYRYVFANAQADELAGQEKGQLLGQTDEAIMTPEALAHTRAIDRRILKNGTTYKAEENLGIGGAERTFQTVKFPLLDEQGRATAVCGISTDVTAQKEGLRLRDELAAAQQDAIDELRPISPGDGRATHQGDRASRFLHREARRPDGQGRGLAGNLPRPRRRAGPTAASGSSHA